VATGLQLGIKQVPVHLYFEAPTVRWNQVDVPGLGFKIFQQLLHKANGPIGVVSDSAIGNINFEQQIIFLMVLDLVEKL